MTYKVIERFSDILDNGYIYNAGDMFPRIGYTPSKARIEELGSTKNKMGRVLIAVPKPQPEKEVVAEEKPAPKKRSKK